MQAVSRLRAVYRALRQLATDERLPRPVRWLLLVGLLPIPGPVDEVALGMAVLLLLCYRRRVREILGDPAAWDAPGRGSAEEADPTPAPGRGGLPIDPPGAARGTRRHRQGPERDSAR